MGKKETLILCMGDTEGKIWKGNRRKLEHLLLQDRDKQETDQKVKASVYKVSRFLSRKSKWNRLYYI